MRYLKYFLNNDNYPIYFGAINGISFGCYYAFFLFKNNMFLYTGIVISIIIFFSLFYIRYKYKKNYIRIVNEIDESDFNEYIKSISDKYDDKNLGFGFKEEFKLFKEKYLMAKDLIEKRFSMSVIFKERLNNLILESLNTYIKNIDVLSDMQKAAKSGSYKYQYETNDIWNKNKELIENIDNLIKKLLIEEKEKNDSESINEDFLRNFEIFERIKRI